MAEEGYYIGVPFQMMVNSI